VSVGRGQLLHLRLFIEGVEVPVIGAMISANENSPATAQIEIIPADSAHRLLPRSKIHLFYLDYDGAFQSQASASSLSASAAALGKGIPDSYYRLLFTGELFTTMYTKTGFGSRSMILQCLDDSNNWDTSYLYLLRYTAGAGETAIVGSTQTFLGLNQNVNPLDDILSQPEIVISQMAKRGYAVSPALRETSGLVGGLLAILELLGGVPGKYMGVTSWHTVEEARIRLLDQLASDSGKTASNLYNLAVFEEWLTAKIGNAGTVISFRDLIELINRYIYYAVVPQPVARYKPGSRTIPDWPEGLLATGATSLDPGFKAKIDEVISLLKSKYGWGSGDKPKPEMTAGIRTLEEYNRLYGDRFTETPDRAHSWGFAADHAVPTKPKIGFTYQKQPAESIETAKDLHQKCLTIIEQYGIGTKEGLFSYLEADEIAALELAASFYKDYGAAAEEVSGFSWGGGSSPGYTSDRMWSLFGLGGDPPHLQQSDWREVVGEDVLAAGAVSSKELEAFYASLPERERMVTQVFRPDAWFVVPPSCNIIFPEEVTSFTYTRQMMRETTRLQLRTFNTLYEDLILNQVYFAPSLEQVESLADGGLGSAAKAIVYPHEKYAGIVPKMERISEVSFYSRLDEEHKLDATDISKLDVSEQEQAKAAGNQIDLWAARTAAFNFLSHRYAARTGVVSGRFIPRVVLGFPALVVDRPVERTAEGATNLQAPTHFLGMVRTLSHAVTQAGGTTTVSLTHARSHKIGDDSDDLFAASIYDGERGVLSVQVDQGKDESTDIVIGEDMDPAEFKFCVALTDILIGGGTITPPPSKDVLPGPKGKTLVLVEMDTDFAYTVDGTSNLTTPGTNAETGEEYVFPFSKVSTTERGSSGLLPLEEAIRPPWFSDEYSNDGVSALYADLFGCGSLLDLVSLEPAEGYTEVSLGQAVEEVVRLYSNVSGGGHSADAWIHAVTDRAYADLGQVIGTEDSPGFHFYASGDLGGFDGWDGLKGQLNTQLNADDPQRVSVELDPRKGRYQRVVDYQSELLRFRGFRG